MAKDFDHQTNWNERYWQLKQYKAEHGDCDVPKASSAHDGLSTWVRMQRALKKTGKLSRDQCHRLERLGFRWEVRKQKNKKWGERLEDLVEFIAEHGHSIVPACYRKNLQLGPWVNRQRSMRRKGALSRERVAALDRVGFAWSGISTRWEERYEALLDFRREHGHVDVPWHHPELGEWVMAQRNYYKSGVVKEEHVALLENVGFEWGRSKAGSGGAAACGSGGESGERVAKGGRSDGSDRATDASSSPAASDGDDARVETSTGGRAAGASARESGASSSSPSARVDGSVVSRVERSRIAASKRRSGILEHVNRHCSYYRNNNLGGRRGARGGRRGVWGGGLDSSNKDDIPNNMNNNKSAVGVRTDGRHAPSAAEYAPEVVTSAGTAAVPVKSEAADAEETTFQRDLQGFFLSETARIKGGHEEWRLQL